MKNVLISIILSVFAVSAPTAVTLAAEPINTRELGDLVTKLTNELHLNMIQGNTNRLVRRQQTVRVLDSYGCRVKMSQRVTVEEARKQDRHETNRFVIDFRHLDADSLAPSRDGNTLRAFTHGFSDEGIFVSGFEYRKSLELIDLMRRIAEICRK